MYGREDRAQRPRLPGRLVEVYARQRPGELLANVTIVGKGGHTVTASAGGRIRILVSNLSHYPTLAQLKASPFFISYREEIEALLGTAEVLPCVTSSRRLSSFIRVVQWNIEKGKRAVEILSTLQDNPILKWADLIHINAADRGMIRSANEHVARMLADALGMHMAFGPAHLELTKGTEDDLEIPGDNLDSMQGNAVLSRYPIVEARIIRLPICFEPFEFEEKRYGRRVCLWTRLATGTTRGLWTGAVHLEVRSTPRCRAAQMKYLMANLPGGTDESYLLGGDLNSNGLFRGTYWRTLASTARLVRHSPARMKELLIHPERGTEPQFGRLREAGFSWEGLNSEGHTAAAALGGIEESHMLPAALVRAVHKRLEPHHGYLLFRLDWLIGRNVHPLRTGEATDHGTGIVSLDPGTIDVPITGAYRLSDHLPIHADFTI